MTELEQLRAKGLMECFFPPGSWENKFVPSLDHIARTGGRNKWLTAKQRRHLIRLCWKHRAQLRAKGFGHVVPAQNPDPPSLEARANNWDEEEASP